MSGLGNSEVELFLVIARGLGCGFSNCLIVALTPL